MRLAGAAKTADEALPARPAINAWADIDAPALAGGGLGGGNIEVAFPEVERNFIERALSPRYRLRLPEDSAFGIQQGALRFLH